MNPVQEKKLNDIHELLAGTLEKPGLAHIINQHQKDIKDLKAHKDKDIKYKSKVAGGMFIGIPAFGVLMEYIKYKIFG